MSAIRPTKWLENPFHRTATEAEDLSYPPSGGRIKMVVFGIILPIVIIYFGWQAWITEEAIWFSNRNSTDLKVKGRTAQAMGVVYASVGVFCHFRWFWGLVPVYRVFEIGTTISLLGVLARLSRFDRLPIKILQIFDGFRCTVGELIKYSVRTLDSSLENASIL